MKKARKLGLQSLALVLMAFVLVAGVAFGMTGAWFTDTIQKDAAGVTMGNKVVIDATKANINSAYSGTRLNAAGTAIETSNAITASTVMPGDTITLTFKVAKGTYGESLASEDFVARMTITATYNSAALPADAITYTQKVDDVAYTNGTDMLVGADKEVEVKLVLNGAFFKNSDSAKGIAVHVQIDAIQAANYVSGNWTDATKVNNGIVAYTADWEAAE